MRKLLLLAAVFSSLNISAETIDDKWEFRGFQASKKMEKTIEGKKKLSGAETCELALESAFMQHALSDTKDIVSKSTSNGSRIKSLVFVSGKEMTQLAFVYEKGQLVPFAWKVLLVAKGHEVVAIKSLADTVSLATGKCNYVFSTLDPMNAVALESK